jgi:hypothetical protein
LKNAFPIRYGRDLPSQLSRAKSHGGITAAWRKMQSSVCSPAVLAGMPKAIGFVAMKLHDVEPHMVLEAIRTGDTATFIAVMVRLNQIDTALVAAGKSLAHRSPVIYAKHLVDGFRLAAEERFVSLGGVTDLPATGLSEDARSEEPPHQT